VPARNSLVGQVQATVFQPADLHIKFLSEGHIEPIDLFEGDELVGDEWREADEGVLLLDEGDQRHFHPFLQNV
jgi:hypothetical protein